MRIYLNLVRVERNGFVEFGVGIIRNPFEGTVSF